MTKKRFTTREENITKKRKSTSLTPKIKESNQKQINNANKSPNNNRSLLEIMKR